MALNSIHRAIRQILDRCGYICKYIRQSFDNIFHPEWKIEVFIAIFVCRVLTHCPRRSLVTLMFPLMRISWSTVKKIAKNFQVKSWSQHLNLVPRNSKQYRIILPREIEHLPRLHARVPHSIVNGSMQDCGRLLSQFACFIIHRWTHTFMVFVWSRIFVEKWAKIFISVVTIENEGTIKITVTLWTLIGKMISLFSFWFVSLGIFGIGTLFR